jgi:hypothetical protein
MLADPTIQFCKAAFRRPFTSGDKSVADGGGRVTELMAKPLINLFYPQLAGFVQPLGGEFAARRELLSALPFFTGYGVEIGMMIDVYNEIGLNAMAQVDIGTRQNRHQALSDLSRMSSVVLRTVAAREGISARLLDEENPALWDVHQPETYLHAVASENGLRLDEHLNELLERPPFARLNGGTALTVPALFPGGYTPTPRTPNICSLPPWNPARRKGSPKPREPFTARRLARSRARWRSLRLAPLSWVHDNAGYSAAGCRAVA